MNAIYLITKPLNFGKPVDPRHIIACKTTLPDAQEEHRIICIAEGDTHEAFVMIHAGMQLLTTEEVTNRLHQLGYKISPQNSFNYFNSGNERHYKARSCYIVEEDTGLSFANIEARRDNHFKELQTFRRYSFGWEDGRIWEL